MVRRVMITPSRHGRIGGILCATGQGRQPISPMKPFTSVGAMRGHTREGSGALSPLIEDGEMRRVPWHRLHGKSRGYEWIGCCHIVLQDG
jgi:hypothetical protein